MTPFFFFTSIFRLITNYGTKKYLKSFKGDVEVDKCKISRDAQWDGFHGVITNLEDKSAAEVLERYRGLWKIEQAFRINKTDLKMRPIFHWKSERIKAHIGICFLAYAIVCRVNKLIKENQLEFSFLDLKSAIKAHKRPQTSKFTQHNNKSPR